MSDVDNEIKLIRASSRADKAEQLLNDETFKDAFESLEAEYIKAWRESGASKTGEYTREKLWLAINVLGKVRSHIGTIVQNGKLAKHELAMREKAAA